MRAAEESYPAAVAHITVRYATVVCSGCGIGRRREIVGEDMGELLVEGAPGIPRRGARGRWFDVRTSAGSRGAGRSDAANRTSLFRFMHRS